MPNNPQQFHLGLVTSRDRSTLRDGELSVATGCEYRVGSPHVYKLPGRSATGNALGSPILAINKVQYDTGTDKLVAQAGGTIYGSVVSTTPVWASEGLTTLTPTAVPWFSAFQDRWILVNGVDENYIREPANVPGTSSPWRLTIQTPPEAPTAVVSIVAGETIFPTSTSGTYALPNNAIDPTITDTSATGTTVKYHPTLSTTDPRDIASVSYIWTFVGSLPVSGRTLRVTHSGSASAAHFDTWVEITNSPKPREITRGAYIYTGKATHKIEYTLDITQSTPTWLPMSELTGTYGKKSSTQVIADGYEPAGKLAVRATLTNVYAGPNYGNVFDINLTSGADEVVTFTHPVTYFYTEQYIDSDKQIHESGASGPVTFVAGSDLEVVNAYSITFTIPPRTNSFATNYIIYRSVDEEDGGYPNLYQIGTVTASDSPVTWLEDFRYDVTVVPEGAVIYEIYTVLYFSGDTLQFEINSPPPPAKMAMPFQGCMVYVPSNSQLSRRLYYSVPSSISAVGIEQVPAINYLEFVTAKNDSIVSIATSNGGLVLLVFFSDYTMVVGMLPQASDPGVFDNRVKEYVTNVRGAAGRFLTCEFTLPSGETQVAAVDRLGLWTTNGSTSMKEWSRDLDWDSLMEDVDLSTAQLFNNILRRRLELIYYKDGYKELHFFYGRIKQDGDGREAPLITGPHTQGVRCKHYTLVGNAYVGFSGDSTAVGQVFLEEGADADESHGYDNTGIVPYLVTSGDLYLGGLGRSHLCEFGYPKFTTNLNKEITATSTFISDSGGEHEIEQTFNAGGAKKLWWHAYADRHRISFSDITNTACPALVGYEVEVRDAGVGRES